MSRTTTRFTMKLLVVAGLCGAATALSPDAIAAPFKTGGYDCVLDAAGAVAAPAAAAVPLCGPVADMAGVPMVLPGPLPLGAAAVPVVVPPVPAVIPPVPAVVPPVPAVVPPVPAVVPPVPIVAPALGAPLPIGAAALPVPAGLPILDMAGGKGAPTGPAPAGTPMPGQPIIPGPPPAG
jgi:hypothetical protein